MKRFVIGDIHGNAKALQQCLDRSNFDIHYDKLIVIGDTVDGYPDTKKCFDILLDIRNLVYVLGNHDDWALYWMQTEYREPLWIGQGGWATIQSYGDDEAPESHRKLLESANPFYEEDNMLFVHGGVEIGLKAKDCKTDWLLWDRSMAETVATKSSNREKLTEYNKVFIGHTPTLFFNNDLPINNYEVWLMDTGAGYNGKLTILDIDTNKYWQSDWAKDLYPDQHGR